MPRPRSPSSTAVVRRLRCAIYTRKSTEEGLDQAFNSLHAQREACEAYIASQRHEGWTAAAQAYDDGGFSGGSMERPGLKRLIADIEAGRIDVVVVYKVDRLTRALSDFAKLVDVFDQRHVSFVSVTQQFNTTTSMGRLTLNVLLSFAQFEREVIGERIRDKIAASKRRGLWMGGLAPLGYDVRDRALVINPVEAATVETIFRRYLALRSVHRLRDELAEAGVVSKQRVRPDGSGYGGQVMSRGALYAILQNRLYRGEIVHKGEVHPGEHQPIIDAALWDAVQAQLALNRDAGPARSPANQPSLLAGLLFDAAGQRLTPTYASKGGRRYRYYVSAALIRGRGGPATSGSGSTKTSTTTAPCWRVPAADLEQIVVDGLTTFLRDPAAVLAETGSTTRRGDDRELVEQSRKLADHLAAASQPEIRTALIELGVQVVLHAERIAIAISRRALAKRLGGDERGEARDPRDNHERDNCIAINLPVTLKRAGREMRLVLATQTPAASPDLGLIKAVSRAYDLGQRLVHDPMLTVGQLAAEEQVTTAHLYRLLRLRWLAPDIITAITAGTQPATLTVTTLLREAFRLPLQWHQQRSLLGFR